ncbi:type VII secretion protein EccB [Amycolatopsis antarctica]|uniref:Type VII secretion protein EccB n=1 Tax=Amycolatopsis antarctica TaxID=1854586 RepID=A0A263CZL6_9PSEU|nr:type VII secretion protein EccB [Amycolatopsis antarctica]OZM71328.1 type VII secretion protein EccB [Amycolatopsis antarctica]
MASKRDLLQAYQFLTQRVVSALITRESDPEQPPFRRPGGAAFGSIAIAVIALAAVGVYGVIVPGGNKAWQDGESVIVVEETGTRYVYVDGHLHPVTNYASALLALGRHAETRGVSRDSLTGVPRGPMIGIPDAPDSLPGGDRVLRTGWSLCSRPGQDATGAAVDESVLMIGEEPAGGMELADEAVLVNLPETGAQYLIRHGYRHQISEADTVAVGLALRSEPQATADMSLVDVLPAGDTIAPIPLPNPGEPSTAVPRRQDIRAGQLLVAETSDGAVRHYLAETDRLRPISELQYDIQRAYEPTGTAYGGAEPIGIPLGLASAAEAVTEPAPEPAPGSAPQRRPRFAGSGSQSSAVCVEYDDGAAVPRLRVDPALPEADPMTATTKRTGEGSPLADQVIVRPGWAALVEAMPSAQAPSGTVVLVTDQGRAYPLGGPKVPEILGYADAAPVRLPSGMVARLPQGTGLDRTAAMGT